MDQGELLVDAFDRIRGVVHHVVDGLGPDELAFRPQTDANSIVWLVWHLTRIQDDHLAGVAGTEQVWTAQGWSERFALPFDPSETGYGHSSEEVAAVRVESADLLIGYHDAVHRRSVEFLGGIDADDLDRVVDEAWDPPVTLGVRLISVTSDDLQHAGQAAYVRGLVERRDPRMSGRPKVAIVGAGFGGICAARELADAPVDVTLVDRHNFHTFSPLLYQVATAGLAPDDIAPNLRGIVQDDANIDTRMATVVGVDFDRRQLRIDEGDPIPYDFLVLAAGAVSSDFGVPGVAEHTIPLKTLADATRLRSEVLARFEEADSDRRHVDAGALTFVVAGGGPTGVELCGALAELFSKVLAKDFKHLDVSRSRVVLVEMTDHLLGSFSPKSQREALVELEARGVEIRLGTAIASVEPGEVRLRDGTTIPARTVIWAAGVKANPLATTLGLPTSQRGEVEVGHDLSVPGHPEVFVIGDLAAAKTRRGKPYPQLAPVAMQAGKQTADNIVRRLRGRSTRRFRYLDKGTMATIGRRSAVAELPLGIRFWGTLGWLSWLGLHLVFLIGFRNRVVVLVNWTFNYFKWDRGHRVILTHPGSTPAAGSRAASGATEESGVVVP